MPSPGRASTELSFELLQTDADLEALQGEWIDLFSRACTRNPFVHPAWMIPWLQTVVTATEDRLVIAIRRESELVAVAPLYRHTYGRGRLSARALLLAGASPRGFDRLTEMSEVLVLPAERRPVMRALVGHLAVSYDRWDWLGLTLAAEQGWLETAWLPEGWARRGANVVHKGVRAHVVLPLPAVWEELRLKRNQREALRRSRNRLGGLGKHVEISFTEGAALPAAVETLVDLHRRRARLVGHAPHDDYFAEGPNLALVREAAQRWATAANATVATLRLDGDPIAARLLLNANQSMFLSFSGADPDLWRLCAPTAVVEASIRRAISAGMDAVNLSVSPDAAKLRWSEQLEFQHEFLLVSPSRRSRLAFAAWWQARTKRTLAMSRRVVSEQAFRGGTAEVE